MEGREQAGATVLVTVTVWKIRLQMSGSELGAGVHVRGQGWTRGSRHHLQRQERHGVVGSRRLETVKYSVICKVPVVCSGGVCV